MTMRWLIVSLSSKKADLEGIKNLVYSHGAEVCEFNIDSEYSLDFFKAVADCEYCVWLDKTMPFSRSASAETAYSVGYLIGKDVPFFCVCDTPDKKVHLSSDNCQFFSSATQLEKILSEKFPEFLEREKQKHARQALLEAGIPFNPDSFAFHIAADNKDECNLFIDAGIDVNSLDAAGTPMLCVAARHNRKLMIEKLLDLGADINAVSKDRGYSPVMDAVWKSNAEIVEYLVKKGANLSYISRDGQPVLVLAVGTGNEQICRMLVDNGADPSVCDSMGMSALAYAKLFKKTALIPLFEAYTK